jgi:hypothetical protein
MEKVVTDDGRVQMRAEFIDHLFSVPVSTWTRCFLTRERLPISWYDAWEEICGTPMSLETAKQRFKLERYATDCILVAQQDFRQGYALAVLAPRPYRIINVQPGAIDRAGVVTWEDA